jgi:thiamine-monophosphate kinase
MPTPAQVTLGIGDDAAIIKCGRKNWVWTVDACVEGVHFDRRWLTARDIGWRSFHAAASDVAAMGARPVAALCSLALPRHLEAAEFRGIAQGQALAARSLGCAIIGGNLTRASELSIHTTLLGSADRPLRRDGAHISDEIWLIGQVGAAAAGLLALQTVTEKRRTPAQRWCARQWRRPNALVAAGQTLRSVAHAAIDISDGLAADLGHIVEASRVRAVLDAMALNEALGIRVHKAASELKREVLDLALFGGEDYALLATGPARKRPKEAQVIGQIEKGRGVWLRMEGKTRRLSSSGFDHFR